MTASESKTLHDLPMWKIWLLASRPTTLTAAIVPVIVGSAYMYRQGHLRWGLSCMAILAACLIQIGTNFTNDLFDFRKGADTKERLGPTRVIQAGLLSERQIFLGIILTFGLAILIGLGLVIVAGPWVVFIGSLSIISGIIYTAGPYPLAYNGLGDLFVFVFFGIAGVCGTVFVQQGYLPTLVLGISLPVGALSTAILVVNNLRDEVTDQKAGKRTLVVRFGRTFGLFEYVGFVGLAYGCPLFLVLSGHLRWWALLPYLSIPFSGYIVFRVVTNTGKALNQELGNTAKLLLLFGLLWAIGIALS